MNKPSFPVVSRNGYYAVDLVRDGKTVRTLMSGIKKESDADLVSGELSNVFDMGAEAMRLEIMGLIPEKERAKVAFAIRWGLSRANVRRLLSLAKSAFVAQERAMSDNRAGLPEAARRAQSRFDKYAADVGGFSITWPGLNPALARDGYENILLPE